MKKEKKLKAFYVTNVKDDFSTMSILHFESFDQFKRFLEINDSTDIFVYDFVGSIDSDIDESDMILVGSVIDGMISVEKGVF